MISVSWVCAGGLECCNADNPDEKNSWNLHFPFLLITCMSLWDRLSIYAFPRWSGAVFSSIVHMTDSWVPSPIWLPSVELVQDMQCLCRYGDQAWIAYSKCGRTKFLYRIIKLLLSNIRNCLFIIPKTLLALQAAWTHCDETFRLLVTKTPTSFSSVTDFSSTFWSSWTKW